MADLEDCEDRLANELKNDVSSEDGQIIVC